MGSRAAFVTYLPHGSAVVSPFRAGEETTPFCPCAVQAAMTAWLLTYEGESGTETYRPRAETT